MLTSEAIEAQLDLMTWCSCGHAPPATAATLDDWVLRAFERDLDDQVEALVRSGLFVPGEFRAVLRADGGLWLTAGHDGFWTIFGVPADAWMPARRAFACASSGHDVALVH